MLTSCELESTYNIIPPNEGSSKSKAPSYDSVKISVEAVTVHDDSPEVAAERKLAASWDGVSQGEGSTRGFHARGSDFAKLASKGESERVHSGEEALVHN